ncbi:ABC transporter substrate-binding protein [Facklamia sp. DSM 111018]|uniref:ABC transporter substrate-binding protein n=1 Tax=Facklamia lactis TaxID=2749967 RepID=A0ABS0LN32_9LACT|nr:ABC transporter substrate-binding protein [Facklamia lactis]MBG9979755.1 ABC transporter substrate-binding protein [Facklamia lactis]MBG9985565.1 ABC transporter substrate-binding protein [Facklamia lactis]
MKKRISFIITLMFTMFFFLVICCNKTINASDQEIESSVENTNEEVVKEENNELVEELPELNIAWGNDLHTVNPHLVFLKPELFENNDTFLRPITDSRLELVKDGEVIAFINFILGPNGSENVTMMSQGHIDAAYSSSTAFMTGIDQGLECSILCPVQSGGVAVVADIDAEYDSFEELVEFAKNSDKPVLAGYHSAVSAPRFVLEYALRDAGLKVSEDTSDYEADVLMSDLKGLNNLVPSLSSNQVEVWAGPIPNPQNAEAQGVGKILAKLDDLPGGKWVDFPCCTFNVRNDIIENYPEVVQALVQITTDIQTYAQNNREDTAELLSDFVGLDVEILNKNDTTYSTTPDDNFKNGMKIYYDAMSEMGKFTKDFKDKEFDEVKDQIFDYSFVDKVQ